MCTRRCRVGGEVRSGEHRECREVAVGCEGQRSWHLGRKELAGRVLVEGAGRRDQREVTGEGESSSGDWRVVEPFDHPDDTASQVRKGGATRDVGGAVGEELLEGSCWSNVEAVVEADRGRVGAVEHDGANRVCVGAHR